MSEILAQEVSLTDKCVKFVMEGRLFLAEAGSDNLTSILQPSLSGQQIRSTSSGSTFFGGVLLFIFYFVSVLVFVQAHSNFLSLHQIFFSFNSILELP